ncbi:MAG: hypothetical protein ACREFT_14955, partial [Acetobacteraceae bacterium]
MKNAPFWAGVRMRRTLAGTDPDSPERLISLPASWEDAAASALAALAGGAGPVRLAEAAEAWIRPLGERAAASGLEIALADRLRRLILARRGAPDAGLWQGRPDMVTRGAGSGFVLNLAQFHEPGLGFAVESFGEAVETASLALGLADPRLADPRLADPRLADPRLADPALLTSGVRRIAVRIADFAGLLSALGLDYRSAEARSLGTAIAALTRGRADAASARLSQLTGGVGAAGFAPSPLPPPLSRPGACMEACMIPGLAEAAAAALAEASAASALAHAATTALAPAGPAEALL